MDLKSRFLEQDVDTGASAMKIAYASWTKGSAALLINVNAYAQAAGVHFIFKRKILPLKMKILPLKRKMILRRPGSFNPDQGMDYG